MLRYDLLISQFCVLKMPVYDYLTALKLIKDGVSWKKIDPGWFVIYWKKLSYQFYRCFNLFEISVSSVSTKSK